MPVALSAALACAAFAWPHQGRAAPERSAVAERELDRVVAVVGSPVAAGARVITLSEVEGAARVALALQGAQRESGEALDLPTLRAGFAWYVDQLLLDGDAARLQVFALDPAEEQAELERFRARFTSGRSFESFLARTPWSEGDLGELLVRRQRVERYLESRLATRRGGGGAPGPGDTASRASAGAPAQRRAADELDLLLGELRGRADLRVLDARFLPAEPGREGP